MNLQDKIRMIADGNTDIAQTLSAEEITQLCRDLRGAKYSLDLMEQEKDQLIAQLKAAQEQEPVGVVEKYPAVQMWVKFNESVDYGESLINGTKLYAKPVIYTKESINMPLNPTKDILVEMHRAINPRHSVIGQMHHVYRAALSAHQGFDIFDRDASVPAQQSKEIRGTNEYGLDMGYFAEKLNIFLRDISRYRPSEAARVMARLAMFANEKVLAESEFSQQSQAVAVPSALCKKT